MLKVGDALSLIQNTVSKLGDDVEFKYSTGLGINGYEELKISLKSPHLKYRHIVYANGGDSIVVGHEMRDELIEYFPYSGDKFVSNSDHMIKNMLSWAVTLGQGEIVEISDKYSQNYLISKGLITPFM